MAIDFKALAAKAVATGKDMTKATVGGGGDYTPPAAGPGLCRLVAYVELGKQKGMMKGKEEIKEKVQLVFELTGKRHATSADEQPHRITVTETLSLNEKANFFKLFNRMNYTQAARHMAELLGEGFKCEVFHDKWTDRMGKERTDVTFRGPAGYAIEPPRKEDEDSETGWVDVTVPAARSEIKCFLWEHPDMEQWGGLFIEGEYPERRDEKTGVVTPAKSKNVLQNKIKAAVNFQGSAMHTLLLAAGGKLDLPEPGDDMEDVPELEKPAATVAAPANDALGGIV